MGSEPAEMMSHIPEEDKLRTEGPGPAFARLAVEHTLARLAVEHMLAGPTMQHRIAAVHTSDRWWIVSTAYVQVGSLWWPYVE